MTLFSVHCCEPSDVGAADGVDAVGSGQLSVCHPLGSKLLSSGCAAKGHLDSLLTLGVGQLSSRTFTKEEPGRVGRSFSQDCRKPHHRELFPPGTLQLGLGLSVGKIVR